MKKRIWSILLALCMVLSLLPFSASAADVSDLSWDITNNTVTITGCSLSASGALVIPAEIRGYPVTAIGDYTFNDCNSLTSVTFPESVTSIGSGAFDRCNNITSINVEPGNTSYSSVDGVLFNQDQTALIRYPAARSGGYVIPDSVTDIGVKAFFGCAGLTSVSIPDGVTQIGWFTFCSCRSLTSITIPSSVTIIGPNAFSGCGGLTSLTIPDGVKSIYSFAFSGCNGLTSVSIPESTTEIDADAFYDCRSLTAINVEAENPSFRSVDGALLSKDAKTLICCPSGKSGDYRIPQSVTSISSRAFSGCIGLTSVSIPDGVTILEASTFEDCTGLTSVSIPDSVTSIAFRVFQGCTGLTSVVIPDSVTEIAGHAFTDCSGLKSITIGKSVRSIGYNAFSGCTSLTSVVIPDSVAVIGIDAFSGCTNLKNVLVPGSVQEFGHTVGTSVDLKGGVFSGCTGLENVIIKPGVARIEPATFASCSSLVSLTIPDSVTSIGDVAFSQCSSLKDIWYSGSQAQWNAIEISEVSNQSIEGATIHYNSHLHDLTAVAAVAPTCAEDGTEAYWKCEDCGKLFSDIWEKNEIAAPAVIPATGHSWNDGEITKQPTETAEGVKTFTCAVCGKTRTESIPKLTPEPTPSATSFTDVAKNAYYAEPVAWAVSHDPQITNGTGEGKFSPNADCTRGQIVTFLWRAKGCPEPKSTDNPFVDVKEGSYCYKAVLWAVEQGITNGLDKTHFGPNESCTRGQAVTFLWRADNQPAAKTAKSEFKDVQDGKAYYYTPVLWAVENGITKGTGNGLFSPDATCTRGQIVTFLWRDLAK